VKGRHADRVIGAAVAAGAVVGIGLLLGLALMWPAPGSSSAARSIPISESTTPSAQPRAASFTAPSPVTSPSAQSSAPAVGLVVGDRAPDFKLKGLDGKAHDLSDYRGKPAWINFWASWCPPCREEMPRIEGLYRQHESEGLVVLGVATSDSDAAIRGFVGEVGVTYPILLDPDGQVAGTYGAVALPVSFWLDRDGIIRDWIIGEAPPDLMASAVERILSH